MEGVGLEAWRHVFALGEEMALDGAGRLEVDQPGTAWLVCSGSVDIFHFPRVNEVARRLYHLARVEQGGIILGMDLGSIGDRLGIVGKGGPLTKVAPLLKPFDQLEPPHEVLAGAVDDWLELLARTSAQVPRVHQQLDEEGDLTLEAEWAISTSDRPRWLELKEARVAQAGHLNTTQTPWQLISSTHWARVTTPGSAYLHSTQSLLQAKAIAEPLTQFHRTLCAGLLVLQQEAEQQEQSRLDRRTAFSEDLQRQTLANFAGVLGPTSTFATAAVSPSDPLFNSMETVAKCAGVHLNPTARDKFVGLPDAINAIARASNIRTRQILLADGWWERDNGPLLSQYGKNKEPVALIPRSPSSYDMVMSNGSRQLVTPELIPALSALAVMLYRPLPEKRLGLKDLLAYSSRGNARDLITILSMAGGASLMGLSIPLAMGLLFDSIIPKASTSELAFVIVALIASGLAVALFEVTKGFALVRLEGRVDAGLQAAIWDRILTLPVPFFRQFTAGDLTNRAMGLETIRAMLSGYIVLSLISSVFGIFYFFLLFYYDVRMAFVAGALVILAMVPLLLFLVKIRLDRLIFGMAGKQSGFLQQLLLGIAKVRLSGSEERAFARWANAFSQMKKFAYKAGLVEVVVTTWNAAFSIGSMIIIFAFLMYINQSDTPMTVGRFVAFNTAFTLFLSGVLSFTDVLVRMLSLVPILERAHPILDTLPESDEGLAQPGELTGALEISQLCFRYNENAPQVLNNVSFKVRPGEFVAIVGPSGSGKSTLLRMLLGFDMPQSGGVYYDGQDLQGLDVRAVRRQVGVVLQNSQLVPGSIFENITGSLPLDMNDAWMAARMVGFEDDIRAMPMDMHTVVSENGGTLSGGQVQRLLIARALVSKPRILYFDEATSALDNQTQAVVTASLAKLKVTRLVIAHRLSTVIDADQILVMEAGRVVESGTYQQLMDMGGVFYRLASRQLV